MNLTLIVSNQTNPFLNVAVENYLVSQDEPNRIVMYLWKNRRTVVIGQNQNPYAECNVETLEADGGYLMRRRTGGGAVYHDDGNLNFSFVVPPALYDQQRQFRILMNAVESYGLHCELSGRNDVLCEGRKFSGNAFSRNPFQYLHHGTILIAGNVDDMRRYLKVKPAKLSRHGVASVQSRVVNLSELADVTPENIVPRLVAAFEQEYGCMAETTPFDDIASLPAVQQLYDHFRSEEWRFGRWRTFVAQKKASFDWGEIELSLTVDETNKTIKDIQLSTDSLNVDLSAIMRDLLLGASTTAKPSLPENQPADVQQMAKDILRLIYE